MKLISMTDFVLERNKQQLPKGFDKHISDSFAFNTQVIKYAHFLKQPLKLSMFVPCDEDGNPLENPNYVNSYHKYKSNDEYIGADKKYNRTKENVLFEDFEFHRKDKYSIMLVNDKQELTIEFSGNVIFYLGEYIVKNIEDLCFCNQKEQTHIILTKSAIKQWNLS